MDVTMNRADPTAAIRTQAIARRLGIFGTTAGVLFVAVLVGLHALRPDISSISNYVSEYANGPYGRFFEAASFIHGIGNAATALGLRLVLAESAVGRRGATLFGVAAASVIVAALFSTDPLGTAPTLSGTIHLTAAFGSFVIEAAALFSLSHAFRAMPSWKAFAAPTILLASLGSAFLLLLIVSRVVGFAPGPAERAALVAFVIWELAAALRLATSKSR